MDTSAGDVLTHTRYSHEDIDAIDAYAERRGLVRSQAMRLIMRWGLQIVERQERDELACINALTSVDA